MDFASSAPAADLLRPGLDDAAYHQRFAGDATESPDATWARIRAAQTFAKPRYVVEPDARGEYPPPRAGCARLVCVSDTHGLHERAGATTLDLPAGDVLVHCGDFTNTGTSRDLDAFVGWLGAQTQFAHKLVIAGNHDVSLDPPYYAREGVGRFHRGAGVPGAADGAARAEFRARVAAVPGGRYLEDEACEASGLRFYGSPWQPFFCDWAFNLARGAPCRERWSRIPAQDDGAVAAAAGAGDGAADAAGGGRPRRGIDVLLTHGPPLGRGDRVAGGKPIGGGGGGEHVGCADLLEAVQTRARPRAHVFGHVHEGYGASSDGVTDFVNASTCTHAYRPHNAPVVLDVPRPGGAAAAEEAARAPTTFTLLAADAPLTVGASVVVDGARLASVAVVNEEEGTCDVIYDDGADEDAVESGRLACVRLEGAH